MSKPTHRPTTTHVGKNRERGMRMPVWLRVILRIICVPQRAGRAYLRCLNRYILARYRRERCVYENRLNTEGFLRSDSSDSNVTVETVLRSEGSSSPKNQVLCISAEPGYGKDFLAKRICVLDYDCAYENQLTTSMWFDPFLVQTGGRMPFIIQEDDVKQYLRKKADGTVTNGNALCCICADRKSVV